jgi:preprotein translocase subunit SecA
MIHTACDHIHERKKIMSFISRIIGLFAKDPAQVTLTTYKKRVEEINALESRYEAMSDSELKSQTAHFKERLSSGKETLEDLLPEAFATVREVSKRVLKMRHFDVQLIGGMVLHAGTIAEMKTGEGKTLVATLPAYLNALEGKGVYIVTVNDYLAKRDSEWMGKIYTFLGLTVGLIQSNMDPLKRIEAYRADITFGTNNEFGFDYLRDNLTNTLEHCCQTRRHFAIIDEVDSILIDEARTPLIISGPVSDNPQKYKKVAKAVRTLKENVDFTIDEKHKNIVLTDAGIETIEKVFKLSNMYSVEHMDIAHMAVQCLKALHVFHKDVDYVVKDGEVVIVDEFTGRLMDGRRFSDGLHQSIEAIEGVRIKEESQTLASITFQNYFRMFPKLAGMTGTAYTEITEFQSIYGLNVEVIPPNKSIARIDEADVVFKSKFEKFKAIASKIEELTKEGQPILVGTIAIETSELLSKLLKDKKIKHNVLNAKHHEKEAEIIANAGQKGSVTIATNMAGRGTDIALGEGVRELGGLYVLGTARHESRRIDNQLRGRSGRQGDPGKTKFYVSLEDDLMRMFGSDRISKVMGSLGLPDDTPIEHPLISKSIEKAQSKVEKYHFSIRKQILEYDDVMNQQRETIYEIRRDILRGTNIEKIMEEGIHDLAQGLMVEYSENGEMSQKNKESLASHVQNLCNIQTVKPIFNNDKKSSKEKTEILCKEIMHAYKKRKEEFPIGLFDAAVTRQVLLMTLDRKWVDHLNNMETLRQGIGLRAWGQRQPLIEYKKEAYDMFTELRLTIFEESTKLIFRAELVKQTEKTR